MQSVGCFLVVLTSHLLVILLFEPKLAH